MNRQEAVSLLREIMSSCESFKLAQAVSIKHDKGAQGYFLCVKWVPHVSERSCLESIRQRYNVEISESEGYTVFNTSKTSIS
jgi:hypothetical protein